MTMNNDKIQIPMDRNAPRLTEMEVGKILLAILNGKLPINEIADETDSMISISTQRGDGIRLKKSSETSVNGAHLLRTPSGKCFCSLQDKPSDPSFGLLGWQWRDIGKLIFKDRPAVDPVGDAGIEMLEKALGVNVVDAAPQVIPGRTFSLFSPAKPVEPSQMPVCAPDTAEHLSAPRTGREWDLRPTRADDIFLLHFVASRKIGGGWKLDSSEFTDIDKANELLHRMKATAEEKFQASEDAKTVRPKSDSKSVPTLGGVKPLKVSKPKKTR